MHKDMISVIIPIYNAEAFLERCLNSVLRNTYKNLQILCVDDGSTDGSPEILSRFAARDPRITVLTQVNAGVSQARNLGLKHAAGEYVCFVDSDDWVHREYFSVLHETITETGADLAVAGYSEVSRYVPEDAVAEIKKNAPHSLSRSGCHSISFVTTQPWGRIFRRSRLGSLYFPVNIHFGEDSIFNVCFISRLHKPIIVQVDVPVYFYYQHPGSLSRAASPENRSIIVQWYLDHMDAYPYRDILLAHICRNLFIYRYEGSLTDAKAQIRRKARRQFRRALPYLLKESAFSLKEKGKYIAAGLSPALYRAQLLAKDPTYREVEKNWKKQKTQK